MKRASIIQCAEVLKYNDQTCCCAVCRDTHARNPAVDTMPGCAAITFALPVPSSAFTPPELHGRSLCLRFIAQACYEYFFSFPPRYPNPSSSIHGVWSNALCGRQRPPAESAGLVVVCCASLADQMICVVCSATPRICTLTLVCACAGALAGMAALQFSDIRCARAPHTCCMPHLSCYTPLTLSVVSVPSVLHQALRVTRLHVHHRTALLREHVRR